MDISEKLDKIIELLEEINSKLEDTELNQLMNHNNRNLNKNQVNSLIRILNEIEKDK